MPKIKPNESQSDFVSRCMSDPSKKHALVFVMVYIVLIRRNKKQKNL